MVECQGDDMRKTLYSFNIINSFLLLGFNGYNVRRYVKNRAPEGIIENLYDRLSRGFADIFLSRGTATVYNNSDLILLYLAFLFLFAVLFSGFVTSCISLANKVKCDNNDPEGCQECYECNQLKGTNIFNCVYALLMYLILGSFAVYAASFTRVKNRPHFDFKPLFATLSVICMILFGFAAGTLKISVDEITC